MSQITNQIVLVELSTIKSIVEDSIQQALSNFQSNTNQNEVRDSENELMDMEELLKFLKVSKVTIHNWKKKGIIKSHKIGRKLFFKKDEILEGLKRQKY